MSPLLTPVSAQAATMNDLVNEMNLVYNCIDDTYTDGSGKTDKDYMSIARQNAQDLALEAYNSDNWNAVLNPLINSQVLAKAGQDDATVRQTFVNAFADLSEVYYISDAAELETRLTTFKNTYRDFFLALFGNDITIDKFAGFLSATRDDFRNAINHSLTTEESNLLGGKSLKEAALYGTNQELTNAMPILMKYAMRNVIEAPGSQYADFDQRLGEIGWSVDLLIAQFKELNSKVDPDNKAQLGLALASVRSQSKVYDLTGATPTTPITNNAISCNVNDTFSIQLKIMDTDLTAQVDYTIVGANPEAIEITDDQGATIDFKAASAGSATLVLYRQDSTVPQHDWIAQLNVTVAEEVPVKYGITVADVAGGTATVTTDPAAEATAGATVTVSIAGIEAGKQFKSITVTDADSTTVATTEVTAGASYTFTMPAKAVTVAVEVEAIPVEQVTVSNVVAASNLGKIKFDTDKATTAEDLAGKIKANGVPVIDFGTPSQGTAGINWNAIIPDAVNDQVYTITCELPFVLTGNDTVQWATTVAYGDVNDDGIINITDALLVLKHITDQSTLNAQQQQAADVNGDKIINITDALLILKHITDPNTPFPVETP